MLLFGEHILTVIPRGKTPLEKAHALVELNHAAARQEGWQRGAPAATVPNTRALDFNTYLRD